MWVRHKVAFFYEGGKEKKNKQAFNPVLNMALSLQKGSHENVLSLHTVKKMSLWKRIFIINEPVQCALPFDFDECVVESSPWGSAVDLGSFSVYIL